MSDKKTCDFCKELIPTLPTIITGKHYHEKCVTLIWIAYKPKLLTKAKMYLKENSSIKKYWDSSQ